MRRSRYTAARLLAGVSALAVLAAAGSVSAQEEADVAATDELVVTGIRASLRQAVDIKRNAQGVVDAISAEDIGKFPDTNLAESLQRITGVSIDRSNGEGSTVTVRGFGPEFNLVVLNGRQMPTSTLGDGASAPSSRSFDFANLASEGVAGVEVYKTGRASVPSGGIGSTINIKTPRPLDRPGLRGSIGVKGVLDTSQNDGESITPEISGIFSQTFADDRFGVLVTGVWQKREASFNQANVGWRDGYLGNENNWGSLANPGDPRFNNIVNRPEATDVYEVPQNASYDLNDIERERINGQLVLQYRPIDALTATLDYTYSKNTVEVRNSNVGVWFNHNDTSSSWTDGPVAGPDFYTERFGVNENKDLSYSGSLVANQSENKSLGFNVAWDVTDSLRLVLDAHSSTAESKPTNQYGSSVSVGNAVFGVASQTIDFRNDLPVISYTMHPGATRDPLNPENITPTGNAFRNAYFKDEIDQVQLTGRYEADLGFLDSIDFGVSRIENKVRSAYGFLQNDTWGGSGPPSAIPDDIFSLVTLPDKFDGLSGAGAGMIQSFYSFDFERMVSILEANPSIRPCGGDGNCLAPYTTDRRINEETTSAFLQFNGDFELAGREANLIAGVRYEETKVDSSALVPVPSGTQWVANNEFGVIFVPGQSDFTTFQGSYDHWLPAIDFDVEPLDDVKLRASYSHTITRADYQSLQGGRTIDQLFRIGGGTGNQGNPGLLPYKSKNIDFSAEWYYAQDSYVSVGWFHKDVENFLSSTRIDAPAFNLTNPASGPRYRAAIAALGPNATATDIRNYIINNYPSTVLQAGFDSSGNRTGFIQGVAGDDPLIFQITTPVNSDQTAELKGWEFALQHNFWDTGFGVILNYTVVEGDAVYDNTKPFSVTQFALTGLSDSANVVAFYDKDGIQGRIAYNWRDEFLGGTGPNPFYIEEYGQWDASASWEVRDGLNLFVEAINLTGEGRRGHRRSDRNAFFAAPGDARYAAGVRYSF